MKPVTRIIDGEAKPLYVIRSLADKTILRTRALSNTTGLPNPGPDVEYLPMMEDDVPTFDVDYQRAVRAEGANEATGQWETTYTVDDKPNAEVLLAAKDVARREAVKVVPQDDFAEIQTIALGAALRTGKPNAEEKKCIDLVIARGAKLLNNRANLDAIKTKINEGKKPDLKVGWEAAVAAGATPVVIKP